MKYYPLYLNLQNQPVLLVGAGEIGLQKIRGFLECEARVHVVSPDALPEIAAFAESGQVRWSRRGYETADLDGMKLVIAATDDTVLQKRIAAESRERGILVNIVDVPPLCDFIAPAIVSRGDVQIAISTGGAAPALAKFLRQKLEGVLGPEVAEFVRIAQEIRPRIMALPKEKRLGLWGCLASDGFLETIKRDAKAKIKEWIDAASL